MSAVALLIASACLGGAFALLVERALAHRKRFVIQETFPGRFDAWCSRCRALLVDLADEKPRRRQIPRHSCAQERARYAADSWRAEMEADELDREAA